MPGSHEPLSAWFVLAWIGGWVAASLVYRKMQGKPIFYPRLAGTKFRQSNASGRSHRSWFTKLGGANGCLVVQVTDTELDIHPFPPFNWMFLPEIYGLEYRVPLTDVRSAVLRKGLVRKYVDVVVRTANGDVKVTLQLAHPDDFLAALGTQSSDGAVA